MHARCKLCQRVADHGGVVDCLHGGGSDLGGRGGIGLDHGLSDGNRGGRDGGDHGRIVGRGRDLHGGDGEAGGGLRGHLLDGGGRHDTGGRSQDGSGLRRRVRLHGTIVDHLHGCTGGGDGRLRVDADKGFGRRDGLAGQRGRDLRIAPGELIDRPGEGLAVARQQRGAQGGRKRIDAAAGLSKGPADAGEGEGEGEDKGANTHMERAKKGSKTGRCEEIPMRSFTQKRVCALH